MEFKNFTKVVRNRFDEMVKNGDMYRVVANRDSVWNLYLDSFPDGTNDVYVERREYDCNTCKNFIRDVGNVVIIKDGKLESVWDVTIGGYYQEVADTMAAFVKSQKIENVFSHHSKTAGCAITRQIKEDTSIVEWNHFSCDIPKKYVDITPSDLSQIKSTVQVFERGLNEITKNAISTVLELMEQGSLYRGDEFKPAVLEFKDSFNIYASLDAIQSDIFVWKNYKTKGARIRNDAIGTLLNNLSEGMDLTTAVGKFENIVAPANYKRPTSLITKGMIDKAMAEIDTLGIREALYRRPAVASDISINNVLWADRSVKGVMKDSMLDDLMGEVKPPKLNLDKIEEIYIDSFIKDILPKITSIEMLLENRHTGNLMSLIAPKNDAPNIFKWNNNFSWNYNGGVTDSMKEHVKKAGGKVDGVVRFSIQWNDKGDDDIDFDAHCLEPGGNLIYYSKSENYKTTGNLDVDIRCPGKDVAVENITWSNENSMESGIYTFKVHNFTGRRSNSGFTAEIEYNGEVHKFLYDKPLQGKEFIEVATCDFKPFNSLTIKKSLPISTSSQNIWEIDTEKFHKVSIFTISPNHWDDQKIGNKHHFFILEGCKMEEAPRGFYNEFLKSDFEKHRKVFEVLGSKTKCEMSDDQLSGLGFSSTKRDSVIVKVQGAFTRTLKINF